MATNKEVFHKNTASLTEKLCMMHLSGLVSKVDLLKTVPNQFQNISMAWSKTLYTLYKRH